MGRFLRSAYPQPTRPRSSARNTLFSLKHARNSISLVRGDHLPVLLSLSFFFFCLSPIVYRRQIESLRKKKISLLNSLVVADLLRFETSVLKDE